MCTVGEGSLLAHAIIIHSQIELRIYIAVPQVGTNGW